MARVSTSLSTVLKRILSRLKDQIDEATDSSAYLSTIPNELPPNPSDVMFEVAPSHNYAFDQEMTGAGTEGVHVITQIIVTVHTQIQLDEVGRDAEYLTNESLGVIGHLTNVLKALSIHDLQDDSGNQILAQPLRPSSGNIPPRDDRSRGYVSLFFECEFDWDVTT